MRPGDTREWTPTTWDNHLDQDPIVITIKQPSEREKRALLAGRKTTYQMGTEDGEKPRIEMDTGEISRMNEKAVESFVVKVTNYSVGGVDITDGAKLAEFGEFDIVRDAADEIMAGLEMTDAEKKP